MILIGSIYALGALFTGIKWGKDLLILGTSKSKPDFAWLIVTAVGAAFWPVTLLLVYAPLLYLELRYGQYGAFS